MPNKQSLAKKDKRMSFNHKKESEMKKIYRVERSIDCSSDDVDHIEARDFSDAVEKAILMNTRRRAAYVKECISYYKKGVDCDETWKVTPAGLERTAKDATKEATEIYNVTEVSFHKEIKVVR